MRSAWRESVGTAGRGIGPAYEDKVARRGLRVGDLFMKPSLKTERSDGISQLQLVSYYKAEAVDYQKVLDTVAVADASWLLWLLTFPDLLDRGASAWRFRHV